MMHGQLSFHNGFKAAMSQIEDQTEKSLINMGLQWAKFYLLKELIGDKAHMTQVMQDAKGAAAGAYNATVGIPFIGPVLAPIAAAGAFTATMAFAEGGWDRVPSDQVAMIHKNEMVLPAYIANPLRETLQQGGGALAGAGGGNTHVHIHAMDSQSFTTALKNNIGGLRDVLHQAVRNGRLS